MEFLVILGLILLNGILAMSEVALISARKTSLAADAKKGSGAAKAALSLAENPDRFLSTIQIGITLIGILTGIYSGDALAADFAELLRSAGVPADYAGFIAKTVIVIAVTYLTLIFGELVPKRVGLGFSESTAKLVARPMKALSQIGAPFVAALSGSTAAVLRVLHLNNAENKVTEEEIKSMVSEGAKDGEVLDVEQDIVERVFSLGDRNVESIMTPRKEIARIDVSMTNAEIEALVKKNLYGVYPLVDDSLDDILGVVYLKDLFGKLNDPAFDVRSVARPAQYFHEDMDVYKALAQLRERHVHYGIVCDEFGATRGIVTYHDILEALLGDLPRIGEDPDIIARKSGGWLVDGGCSFYDFLEYFGMENLDGQYKYNSVSGLIVDLLERFPQAGDTARWNGFEFEIMDMDGARIDKLLVSRLPETQSAAGTPSPEPAGEAAAPSAAGTSPE